MQFEEIYESHRHKIFRLCKGYINDDEWAKDLVQETFIQVHLNLKKFRNESSIGTWVYRIASNICLRQLDRAGRLKTVSNSLPVVADDEPEDMEKVDRLYYAIAQLDKADRLIITMVLDGLSNKEISDVLGITEVNTRVKIHRIKKSLSKGIK